MWMSVGIAFGAWKTKGFHGGLIDFDGAKGRKARKEAGAHPATMGAQRIEDFVESVPLKKE